LAVGGVLYGARSEALLDHYIPTNLKGQNLDTQHKLQRVLLWLLANSLRTEKVQFNQLQIQNCANVFRKTAFAHLIEGSVSPSSALQNPTFCTALEAFREDVSFDISNDLPVETTDLDKIKAMEDTHGSLPSKAGTSIVAEIRKSLASGHNNGSVEVHFWRRNKNRSRSRNKNKNRNRK